MMATTSATGAVMLSTFRLSALPRASVLLTNEVRVEVRFSPFETSSRSKSTSIFTLAAEKISSISCKATSNSSANFSRSSWRVSLGKSEISPSTVMVNVITE